MQGKKKKKETVLNRKIANGGHTKKKERAYHICASLPRSFSSIDRVSFFPSYVRSKHELRFKYNAACLFSCPDSMPRGKRQLLL